MPQRLKIQAAGSDVSVQCETDEVPHDGRYYLLRGGQVIKSYRSQNQVMKAYKALLDEIGYQPPNPNAAKDLGETLRAEREQIEFYRSELYWGNSHSYRSGGKLNNR
jgi:hypothetical protein